MANNEFKQEEEDEYEVDNEFFVPHGYLSDGEEEKDEDEVQQQHYRQTMIKFFASYHGFLCDRRGEENGRA